MMPHSSRLIPSPVRSSSPMHTKRKSGIDTMSSHGSQLSLFDVAGAVLQMQMKQSPEKQETRQPPSEGFSSTTNNCISSRRPSAPKTVKFGELVIHEHKLTIGDMPWKDGPPVALSWEQVCRRHYDDLDDYEQTRVHQPRRKDDLRTSAEDRREMLKESGGYTDSDLIQAERLKKAISSLSIRSRRRSSNGGSSSRW